MANKNTKYMDSYRVFESAIRAAGYGSVKEYEDQLQDGIEQGKIRICRMMRNYIEHENGAFIEATEAMIDFIIEKAEQMNEINMPVKKKMIAVRYGVKETDPIMTTAGFMTRRKTSLVPVFDDKDFAVGVVGYYDIVLYIASGDFTKAKKTSVITKQHKFGFVNENETMESVEKLLNTYPHKVFLVLGKDKKVIGWISKQD